LTRGSSSSNTGPCAALRVSIAPSTGIFRPRSLPPRYCFR
jgi:hypothetical protein